MVQKFNCIHLFLFAIIVVMIYHLVWPNNLEENFNVLKNMTSMPLNCGVGGEYQRIGIVYSSDNPQNSHPLFGKYLQNDLMGRPMYMYFYYDKDGGCEMLPICLETDVRTDDIVNIPGKLGGWKLHIYEPHLPI